MQILKTFSKTIAYLFIVVALAACNSDSSSDANKVSESNEIEQTNTTISQPALVEQQAKFTVLENPIPVATGAKIEVTELFWYGCGHCFALEPLVKSWLETKPDNAEFIKMPAIFSASWAFHGQAFYTMEALGVLEQANDAFFHQTHALRKPINNLAALVEFMADFEKSEQEVTSAFNSFAVDSKLRNATNITKQSSATGVPAILVDGKYLTSVSQAGGQAELFDVIDELINKASSER